MFWGLILKSNKKYTQTLEKSFHLSQASLDHASSDNEPVQVMYVHDENSYLLCTLQKGKVYQCPLDLNFQEGDKLCFSTKGNGIVHLTGFLTDEFDDFGGEMDDLDEAESETEEMPDLRRKLEKKKKKQNAEKETSAAKKSKQQESDDDEDDEDEEDDDDSDADMADGKSSDEEEGSDEEDDSEEEDESEEEDQSPPKKQPKLESQQNNKKEKMKNGVENGNKKQDQQQQKKNKGEEGKTQKLQGGLVIQDLKVGSGAEAKPGKKIQVYYEGRLKSNNKVFDATKNGPGFKFSLGRGEVIKGWDMGVVGMKVGGKRRMVCPPQLAYGAKGNPPVIPQNATLVFDVELKNVL